MKRTIMILLGVMTMGASVLPSQAQPGMRDRKRPPLFDDIEPGKMRQRIEDLRKVKLIDMLQLEGDQVEKFFGVYNQLQKEVYNAKDAMDTSSRAVWEATEVKSSSADLPAMTATLLANMKALENAVNARHDGVRKVLNATQFAKYLAFEARFRDELERMILKRVRDRMRD